MLWLWKLSTMYRNPYCLPQSMTDRARRLLARSATDADFDGVRTAPVFARFRRCVQALGK